MSYLNEVKLTLENLPMLNLSGRFSPCTPDEVINLERRVGLMLPVAYKEFLLWSGHGLGRFEIGSDFYYNRILQIQEWAQELLIERNSPDKLPDDAFVFWMHGGYQFAFFCTSEGDNPPVHYFYEMTNDDKVTWKHDKSFTEFLIVEMRDQARHIENARRAEDEIARDWQNA